jgi:hypothetical protein
MSALRSRLILHPKLIAGGKGTVEDSHENGSHYVRPGFDCDHGIHHLHGNHSREEGFMTYRSLLIIKAVVCLFFGAFLLAAPGLLFGILGGTLNAGGMFTAREYGAALIGTLLLTWFAKDVKAADARRAILLDLLVYDGIGVVITFVAVMSGVLTALGWGVVIVYLFFTIGSGYLLLVRGAAKA